MMKSQLWSLAMAVAGALGVPLALEGNDCENVYRVLASRINPRTAWPKDRGRTEYPDEEMLARAPGPENSSLRG